MNLSRIARPLLRNAIGVRRIVTTTEIGDNLVRISMASEPVNSLDLDLVRNIKTAVDAANNSNCDGIIFSSSCRVFSAGLDLKGLHGASNEFLVEFWTAVQDMCFALYSSDKCVVAEIEGHAPAAGTILSLCCDVRVAAPGVRLGLNESAFGLVCPRWACEMMEDNVGRRVAYTSLSLGTLYSSQESLAIGLVDCVVDDPSKLAAAARAECLKWTSKPGRAALKASLRGPVVNRWRNERDIDLNAFLKVLTAPVSQQRIGDYLQSLSKKSK
jgi:enoyl-CoA hydratase/carnithine racemase